MLGKLNRKIILTKHNSKPAAHNTTESKEKTNKKQTRENGKGKASE